MKIVYTSKMKIKWKDEYKTGKTDVDEQHKYLFDLFNDMVDIIEFNNKDAQIEKYIKTLEYYAINHFEKEESTLEKLPMDMYRQHIAEHDEFKTIIEKLYSEIYADGDISSLYQISLFLSQWLINHVQYSDKYDLNTKVILVS